MCGKSVFLETEINLHFIVNFNYNDKQNALLI